MKKKIIIDPYSTIGHFTSILRFASQYLKGKHKVIFIGDVKFKSLVNDHGFEYLVVNPVIFNYGKVAGLKGFFDQLVFNGTRIRHEKEYNKSCEEYDPVFDAIKPDIVLVDVHYRYKHLFYERYDSRIIKITTMVPSEFALGNPPIQSTYIYKGTIDSAIVNIILWLKFWIRQWMSWVHHWLIRGQTNSQFLRLKNKKQHRNKLNRSELLICTVPRAFDFEMSKYRKSTYFLGNQVFNEKPISDHKLKDFMSLETRPKSTYKLIYCSLGTLTITDVKKTRFLFVNIIELAKRQPDLYIVLSAGIFFDVFLTQRMPKNIMVVRYAPQICILNKVDIIICHGGINSIIESIKKEVPLLIYPLSKRFDQFGNSSRAVYHKIAIRGDIEKDDSSEILKKINILLSNYGFFKENIKKLNNAIKNNLEYENELLERLTADLVEK